MRRAPLLLLLYLDLLGKVLKDHAFCLQSSKHCVSILKTIKRNQYV